MPAINIDVTRRIPVVFDGGNAAKIRSENAPPEDKADQNLGV